MNASRRAASGAGTSTPSTCGNRPTRGCTAPRLSATSTTLSPPVRNAGSPNQSSTMATRRNASCGNPDTPPCPAGSSTSAASIRISSEPGSAARLQIVSWRRNSRACVGRPVASFIRESNSRPSSSPSCGPLLPSPRSSSVSASAPAFHRTQASRSAVRSFSPTRTGPFNS